MYISKKKTYKILACAMSAILIGSINGVASAEGERTVDESNYTGGDIFGEDSNSDASNNTLNVSNITTDANQIDAARSKGGNANKNTLNIRNVTATASKNFFHGGYSNWNQNNVNDTAEWNIINFYSGTAYEIHGAHTIYGDATNNTVNFYDGTVTHEIGGGYSGYGNVNYNRLNIYGGTINATVYGGRASYGQSSSNGDAIGNYMNISGGKFGSKEKIVNIYGGWAPGGTASDNEINIYGNPTLVDAILIAGEGSTISNNSLKIHTKNLTVRDIQGFENLSFYLPANTVNGDTILTVTNPTQKISNYIYVYKDENLKLNDNDTITLITTDNNNPNGLNLGEIQPADENDSDYKNIQKFYSTAYPNAVKSLTIKAKDITKITPAEENEENKMIPSTPESGENVSSTIFNEPIADSVSLLDSGTDRLLEWLPPEGVDYMNSSPTAGFDPFIGIGGSKLEINTGNGTKLKTKNGGINFGLTRYLKNRHGIFIIAPVVDYGQDSYESTLNDENRTQGRGNSKYFMAGLIARQACVNGMYYEASIRGGKIKTDFHSDNFLVNNVPTSASYDASTPCYAGHLRIGWRNHISPKNILDVYGMYSLNHIKGFNTTVSTGENYSFSTVNSGRIRIGARLTRELRERESVYSSISYIHEFTGETTGEYMGMSTRRTGLKGSAGLIELGWQVKPAKNSAAMIDTSISCWVGDRKGFMFATKFKKDF